MAEERIYQGSVYRRNGPGEQWVLVGPAQQRNTPRPVQIGGPDPARPSQIAKARADAETATATAPYAGPAAAAAVRKAEADARKAELDVAGIEAETASTSPEVARARAALSNDNILEKINEIRQVSSGFNTGNLLGTEGFASVPFVGQGTRNLRSLINTIKGNLSFDRLQQMRNESKTGGALGQVSNIELQLLGSTVADLDPTQDREQFLRQLATIERHYRRAQAFLNNEDPRDEAVAEKYGIIPAANDGEMPGARGSVSSEGNTETDPALAGLNAKVARMIRDGADAQRVRDYLNAVRPGLGSDPQNLDAVIARARQNPSEAPRVDLERYWQPAEGFSRTLGDVGMTPWGTAAIGAADFISGGTLDNFTANPDLTRATMEGVASENPWSYFAGQMAGGIGSGSILEAGLGRAGLGAANAIRGGDLVSGAIYGAGSADDPGDSRVASALMGGAGGLGGGIAGRALSRGAGTVVGGVSDELVKALDRAGVRMTPGQVAGGALKRTEDRLAGFPLVGDQIRARRMEGLEDFNNAALAEAVSPIGAPAPGRIGEAGVNINQQAISDAYDAALNGRTFAADPAFQNDVAAALLYGRSIPQLGDQFDAMASHRVGSLFDDQGNITGRGFQDAVRGLRQASGAASNEIMSNEFDQGVGMLDDALRGLVTRQAPDVLPAFDAANAAYRNQSVIDDAVLRAINAGGQFTPSQLGAASRQNAKTFGGKRAAARGERPFFELQRAGQEVLPSNIPDSGTAGRAIIPALAFAAGGGGGYAASEGDTAERAGSGATSAVIAALLASAPYSPAARAAVQRILVSDRPAAFRRAGEIMVNNDTIAGLLASPAATVQLLSDK